MEDTGIKLRTNTILVVDKREPRDLVDLYVDEEDFLQLCHLFGSNRVTVALRIKGIG